jgi:alkanesulfonate monooxygenase SsuD/methylene tetrahydromethanopterin reductase-like flavin-dependent oxidoreductase (luciferase family)
MLCGGRLTVGIGIGGRVEDYEAVGADPTTQTMRGMAERVAVMKRVWAGEKTTDSKLPVGPAPVQAGGPPLLIGTIGPKTLRSAASWADGLAGTTLDLDVVKQNQLFDVARAAWAEAAKPKPHLATSFWFAVGSVDDARVQVHRHLRRYMNWIPPSTSTRWHRPLASPAARTIWLRCCASSRQSAPTKSSSSQPVPISINFDEWPTW